MCIMTNIGLQSMDKYAVNNIGLSVIQTQIFLTEA